MTWTVVLAHPLTQQWELPVSPLFVSALAVVVLVGAGRLALRGRASTSAAEAAPPPVRDHQGEPSGPGFWTARAAGLALLVLAITAGRLGHPSELSNIAPSLVMGTGWPLLVLASAALGHVWRWIDPFDTLARLLAPLGAGDGDASGSVTWAVPAATAWTAYLTMWPGNLTPRSVGAALLIYLLVTLACCLALGRRTWLARGEVFGVFFGLIAGVRQAGARANLPAGAHLLLAVLCGGFAYGLLRDSQLLVGIGYGPRSTVYSAIALGICIAAAAVLAWWLLRGGGAAGVGAVGLVPAAVGLALALALARNRLTTSAQLVAVLATDPFGAGTGLVGTRSWVLAGRPLGTAGLLTLQIALLVAGHVTGVVLAGRRARAATRRRVAGSAAILLATLLAVSTAAVAATALG